MFWKSCANYASLFEEESRFYTVVASISLLFLLTAYNGVLYCETDVLASTSTTSLLEIRHQFHAGFLTQTTCDFSCKLLALLATSELAIVPLTIPFTDRPDIPFVEGPQRCCDDLLAANVDSSDPVGVQHDSRSNGCGRTSPVASSRVGLPAFSSQFQSYILRRDASLQSRSSPSSRILAWRLLVRWCFSDLTSAAMMWMMGRVVVPRCDPCMAVA